jgi:uncharacterized membrane-anchored protein YitT (DUF2179 family)
MAAAVNCIFEPMGLVTGGVTGIGIIIKEITGNVAGTDGIPLWMTNLVCNIPLFILAYYMRGKAFVRRGLLLMLLFTVFLAVIPMGILTTDNLLLNAILGGVVMGLGVGMVFAAGATTGGMDLLALLLHMRIKQRSEAQMLAILDGGIVLAGAVIFGLEHALCALIAVFISMRISDGILMGLRFTKMVYIISDNSEEIADFLMKRMERGVTGIETVGMHTGKHRNMLLCVVPRKQVVQLKEMTLQIDPQAFVIVTDASEILGEGFYPIGHNTR